MLVKGATAINHTTAPVRVKQSWKYMGRQTTKTTTEPRQNKAWQNRVHILYVIFANLYINKRQLITD